MQRELKWWKRRAAMRTQELRDESSNRGKAGEKIERRKEKCFKDQ